MRLKTSLRLVTVPFVLIGLLIQLNCGAPPSATNVNVGPANAVNTNNNAAVANSNVNSSSTWSSEIKEPDSYEAIANIRFEAVGDQQNATLPAINAKVARSGQNRRMEFTLPTGGKAIFLDLNGSNVLILPDKKQYADLDREALGFEARRLLMPEEMVRQLQSLPGVQRVGEERYNGRDAIRYQYAATANTGTQAGQVNTNSYFLVDKLTGLPLRTEAVSKSNSGANVQGYSGIKVVTEISDISTDAPADLFQRPADYQKIDPQQVRAQVELIFNSIAAVVTQIVNQSRPPANSPATSPTP